MTDGRTNAAHDLIKWSGRNNAKPSNLDFCRWHFRSLQFLTHSRCACRSRRPAIPGFDGLDGILKRLFQNAPAYGPKHEAEHVPLEGLTLAYNDNVNGGRSVGLTRKGVDVA